MCQEKRDNLLPRVLGCCHVRLAIQSNVRERVAVKELHGPVQKTDQTLQTAEDDRPDNVTLGRCAPLCGRAELSQSLDDGHDETSQADAAEAIREGSFECAARGSLGEVVFVEIPRTVHSRDGNVDGVFEPPMLLLAQVYRQA
jgi:hypothetical protein